MPVDSTHLEYDAALSPWLRARDVLAGEDAVKLAGERYLPRLQEQSADEYAAYRVRAAFFNATSRTADGFLGLIFRRPPFVKLPEGTTALGRAMSEVADDTDLLGLPLIGYAKKIVLEVIVLGRAGTLIDWEQAGEQRAFASLCHAENIINWRVERINGRNLLTLVVLAESGPKTESTAQPGRGGEDDPFVHDTVPQLRVLRLQAVGGQKSDGSKELQCVVDVWQLLKKDKARKPEWRLVETRIPLRLGKPLPRIPFVFHGPRDAQPGVDKLPLADVIAVNLDHYRLDADYKHGMHFTALPTAYVCGFAKEANLRIGSSTAWSTDVVGATAGFLEYTGQGLTTFERAMDRDERLLAVLGARLLEGQKRVGETAETIELRQSGENSVLGTLAQSVSASLTQVLRWVFWWNSTEELPDDVSADLVTLELNTDFSLKGMTAQEITAVVSAWQKGAISQDTMLNLFRRGEVLPDGRTNEEELQLVEAEAKENGGSKMEDGSVPAGSAPDGPK